MTQILTQVFILLIFIIVGFFAKRKNIINDETVKGISSLVINILLPCLILASMNGQNYNLKILKNSYYLILIGFLYYGFAIIYSFQITRLLNKEDKNLYILLFTFANVGYMGYPVIYAIFGDTGVFYTAIYNLSHGIFLWTIGISLMKNENNKLIINLRNLLNPGILVILLGFMFFLINYKIPVVVYNPMKSLGDACTPMAMIVIGSMFDKMKLKSILRKDIVLLTIIKMLIVPLALFLILKTINIDSTISNIIILISAMPCGANSVIFAREYNKNYHLASKAVMFTTISSVITLPIILFIIFY